MRKLLYALVVCCTAPVAAAQCLPGNDAQPTPFAKEAELTRVMGAGMHGTAPQPAERTLVRTAAAQPAARAAPLGLAQAAPDNGKKAGEGEDSQKGPMLLTALAVMFAIALRRIGAAA
jgi:hypothetical protein